jgi:signal transduction histidine kinase
MPRLLLVLCILCYALLGHAQQSAVDSLETLLKHTTAPTEKVNLLNELANLYYNSDVEKGYAYASEAVILAHAVKDIKGERLGLMLQGFYFYGNGNFDEALRLYKASSGLEKGNDDLKAYNLAMTGNVHLSKASYDSALSCYTQAISVLQAINSDKYLAYAYKNLGRLCVLQWKNDLAKKYFSNAFDIYQRKHDQYGIADTQFALADVSKNQADYKMAEKYVASACVTGNKLNDVFLKLHCLINQGELDYNTGEYMQALQNLLQATEATNLMDVPEVQAKLYLDLGDVYEALGQNDISLKYFLESLKISERLGFKHSIAKVQSSLGWIYKNQHNYRLAHEWVDKSYYLRKEIGDEHGVSNSFNVKGVIFYQQQMYDSALVYLERSLEIRRRIGHKEGVSACLFNKALVLEAMKKFQPALDLQHEALAIENTIQNKFTLGISYNSIGSLYTQLKQYDSAYKYLKDAEQMSLQTKSLTLSMNNQFYWSDYFKAKGDYKRALEFHERYADLNDSIYYEMGASKLAELQAFYQLEKKDHEIKLLSQEKLLHENEIDLQKSRIHFQTIIIISVIAGLLLVSLLAFKSYQYNKQIEKAHREITEQKEEIQSQSEELIEANQIIADINKQLEVKIQDRTRALTQAYKELDTFFYRASHDFRRPLTTFLGLAEVANVTVKDKSAIELFEKVRTTAVNLDKMLVKLQSISDVGSQELVYKEVMLRELFENVCDSYRDEIQRNNIRTSTDIHLTGPFISYPAMVKIILDNLVENAIHFCNPNEPFVKLHASQDGGLVTIEVIDNGAGILPKYQDQVFDMYFRGSERSKGNGLGLYIVKKAVQKLEGSVKLTSGKGAGTTITVVLPNDLQASHKFSM